MSTKGKVVDGLLMPLVQSAFIVLFDNQTKYGILTKQIISVDMDWLNRSAIFKISHPIAGNDLIRAVKELLQRSNFSIFFLRANNQPMFCLEGCKIIKHEFKLNYVYSEEAVHIITINYSDVLDSECFTLVNI